MVKTRIAPSPTGQDLHIGSLQTALFNYAFAKKNNGKFAIRIEDTDRARLVEAATENFLKTLKDYGIFWDEGPLYQSERLDIYKKHVEELISKDAAYYCSCSKERLDEVRKEQVAKKQVPKYDRHCRDLKLQKGDVVRLKVPDNKEIVFRDVVRGEIRFNSNEIDDQVLLKSDGYPTYHLAVVVDDHLMEITHLIRGEEWISSTPKHILIYDAFGWDKPVFAHQSLLRNPDKSKLSKRKNPVWASWYLEQGFLPEAVLNFLALLGWSHPEGKEIFDLNEFIRVFDPKDLQVVGPVFDPVKLEWMNGEYIRKTDDEELKSKIFNFYSQKYSEDIIAKTIPLIKERIKKLSDYFVLCEFFFKKPDNYEIDLSSKKDLLQKITGTLSSIESWKADVVGEKLQELTGKENIKTGEFFMILRVVMTGKKISPPLNESMEVLGKEECLGRLKKLI